MPYALSFHCCLHLPPLTTISLLHPSPPLPILPLLSSVLLLHLPSIHCLQGSGSPDEHAQYVWEHYVNRSAAKRIDIVAHSYGGCVTVTLVREPCVTVTLVREPCVTVTLVREPCVTVTLVRESCVTVTLVREPCVTVTLVREPCVTVTLVREPCVTVTLVREPCVTVTLVREPCVTVTSGRRTVCHCEISKRTCVTVTLVRVSLSPHGTAIP